MKVQIKHRHAESILYECEAGGIREALVKAVDDDAYLRDADLRGADLGGADLRGAYLRDADLRGADLGGADLGGAYLRGADLGGADLGGAYLGGADLRGADLGGADLRGAYLRDADLRGAGLRGAYLRGADLRGAYLGGAYLRGAYLRGIKNYADNHDIALELIRREKIETFKKSEWEIVGEISVHRFCWGTLLKQPLKPILRVFKILKERGFGEYYDKAKEFLKKETPDDN
jgi:hypothetical protein